MLILFDQREILNRWCPNYSGIAEKAAFGENRRVDLLGQKCILRKDLLIYI